MAVVRSRASPGVVMIRRARLLLAAAHIGPATAVALIAGSLAVAAGLDAATTVAVTVLVLAGQLTIGWANDLLDAPRDRAVGRTDKPLATGELPWRVVVASLVLATVVCLLMSLTVPWPSAVLHLGLIVASGHAYNAGLKATPISWLPYAVAFGSLPAVVTLAGDPPVLPPGRQVLAAATLGVAAHLLNALPDLSDDTATGVVGAPHRLGSARSRGLAVTLLVAATAMVAFGPGVAGAWAWLGFAVAVALGAVALQGGGRRPFQAAVGIALVDVALLVSAGRVAT